ncbi:MAG: zinc-ribbon domain-containing protein, partial [Lachnospiraceae bacterium]|nr:zinc-ribbon domain-containing protein [Lachnospiraceae bacterium]
YKRDSDEISLALICCSLGLPIVVGAIPGILFHSTNLASGGIAALYILWMAIYVKKRKAEVLPGGYVPKHKWEVWLNQVMDSQAFLISVLFLMPFFPGFFILGVTASFIDNDGIILLMTLIGIVGTFVVWFKILGGLPPKEADDSHSEEDTGTAQKSSGIKEELESGSDIHGKISMAACPSCGKKINENAKFCIYCGKEIDGKTQTEMITCGNCGKSIAKDANFCVFCGEKNIGKDN